MQPARRLHLMMRPSSGSSLLLLSICCTPSHALQHWVDSLVKHRACEIGVTRTGCRGLVATRDLMRGERVLTVPRRNTISVDRHASDGDDTPWLTRLALSLAEEMHSGNESPHALFITSLPAPPHAPHRWSSEDLQELQNRTLVAEAVARASLVSLNGLEL